MSTPVNIITHVNEESGSALVGVLVFIVVSTLLLATMLTSKSIRQKLVVRDIQELSAQYAAESGLELALATLDTDAHFRGNTESLILPGGASADASVTDRGLLLRLESRGKAGREESVIVALVGREPSLPFQSAVWLSDPTGGLTVAGTTRISGPIHTGVSGIERGVVARSSFRGSIEGEIVSDGAIEIPSLDNSLLASLRTRAGLLFEMGWSERPWMRGEDPLAPVILDSDVTISSAHLVAGRTVVVRGSAHTTDSLDFPDGSTLFVRDSLIVSGAIRGNDLLFYARRGIRLRTGARAGGQFISEQDVVVDAGAHLFYPSIVYAAGETLKRPIVHLQNGAHVDGTVIVGDPDASIEYGVDTPVVIENGARIRGGILSYLPVDLRGEVWGSVVATNLQFYVSPTVYINWMLDAMVSLPHRPEPYVIPPGLSSDTPFRAISVRTEVPNGKGNSNVENDRS